MSLAIALVIVLGTWGLFRQSLHLLFDGVPTEIDLAVVRKELFGLPSVVGVHDLHIWAMGTSQVALTAHMVLEGEAVDYDALLHTAEHMLEARFRIQHVTLQLESSGYASDCPLQGHACG
jgi:cobalt-zinc-cadmium efflux system protein